VEARTLIDIWQNADIAHAHEQRKAAKAASTGGARRR